MEYFPENETGSISAIRAGNEAAYRSVYLYYYNRLCVYVLNFTPDREIAEDVVQEVFLKLWTGRKQLRPEGSLNGYLYTLTYREFVNTYRRNRQHDKELEIFRQRSLSDLLEGNEDVFQQKLRRVKKAVEELPPRCREIFIMNKQHGLRHKEIAKQLNISVKTVENQVGKAMSQLRKKVCSDSLMLLFLLEMAFSHTLPGALHNCENFSGNPV